MNRHDFQPFYPAQVARSTGQSGLNAQAKRPIFLYQSLIAVGISLTVFTLSAAMAAIIDEAPPAEINGRNSNSLNTAETTDEPLENIIADEEVIAAAPLPDNGVGNGQPVISSPLPVVDTNPTTNDDSGEDEEPVEEPDNEDDVDRRYGHIDQEIKDLAGRLGLTEVAKEEFYDHDPQIFDDETSPGYDCRSGAEEVVVYGCWRVDNIDILRTASMETTIAHELLHAIYYDFYVHDRTDELNHLLEDFKQSHSEEINEILEIYGVHYGDEDEETRQWAEYSELHSFIGTQFAELPEELEEHYAQYFKDRQQIVNFYNIWQDSIEQKRQAGQVINQDVRLQDIEYQKCVYDLGVSGCADFQADRPAYEVYGECLTSHITHIDECLEIKPALVVYPS